MRFDAATGWWFPPKETHLQDWMLSQQDRRAGRLLYQGAKYRAALALCGQRRVAVDIGAHVGLWAWQMAQDFAEVVAFEPVPAHRDCFAKNMDGAEGMVTLHPYALGDAEGEVVLQAPDAESSGGTQVLAAGAQAAADRPAARAQVKRLDDFGLTCVDLLKLDCEGYELFALRGAMETIRRCLPVVVCEQKPETGGMQAHGVTAADMIALLEPAGYRLSKIIQGDYYLTAG